MGFNGCPGGFAVAGKAGAAGKVIISYSVVLPIELLYFKGICSGRDKVFNWETASETNNDFFTIEKSSNGIDFLPVVKVKGAGSSTSKHSYSNTISENDEGFKYYRLKQTDHNGAFTNSNIIYVSCQNGEIQNDVLVYPNPATNLLNINCTLKVLSTSIIDVNGRLITTTAYNTNELNIANLAKGIYFLSITTENGFFHSKFVKE